MRWTLKPKPSTEKVIHLQKVLGVSETIASLLVQRGIETYDEAKTFFRPTLNQLHDPFLMKDMDKAVSRILKAVENEERILVYGDYDVDGTTSVALMSTYLQTLSPNITAYIPDRYAEGYGISYQGIEYAYDNEITLIVALDCGIKAIDENLISYLDLVATAIGADIVPMNGENRVLAFYGLQVINSNPRPGFKALIAQAKKQELTITDVVFTIAPRINAAGRMKHGLHAVELLVEQDYEKAKEFAIAIEAYNYSRREADKEITEEALLQIKNKKEEALVQNILNNLEDICMLLD